MTAGASPQAAAAVMTGKHIVVLGGAHGVRWPNRVEKKSDKMKRETTT
jgi:hypothetical protein